jgi:hypothetical protein
MAEAAVVQVSSRRILESLANASKTDACLGRRAKLQNSALPEKILQ